MVAKSVTTPPRDIRKGIMVVFFMLVPVINA